MVEKVLNSLTSFTEMGLIQKPKLKDLCSVISPLLAHPNQCIRFASIGYISAAVKRLPLIDIHCSLYPLILPFLKFEIPKIDESSLMENLKPPVCYDY